MKKIKQLVQNMSEELCDAEKYIKAALRYREQDKQLADMYYDLSKEQLGHATMEHEQASRIIKSSKDPAPASMLAIWQWQHEKMTDYKARILVLIGTYK